MASPAPLLENRVDETICWAEETALYDGGLKGISETEQLVRALLARTDARRSDCTVLMLAGMEGYGNGLNRHAGRLWDGICLEGRIAS